MAENNFYPVQDNRIESIDTERGSAFVDLAGLEYFWNNAKEYIDTGDSQPIDLLSDNVVSKPFDIYKTYIGDSDGEYEYGSGLSVFKGDDIRDRYNCVYTYVEGYGLVRVRLLLYFSQAAFSDGSAILIGISEDLAKITLQYIKPNGTPATPEDECYGKKVYAVDMFTPIHRACLPSDLTDIKASQIVLEYQQTISEEDNLRMYVLKSKAGFEKHNINVVKRLVSAINSDDQSTKDQEMFFATFNGNINGASEVFSAPLHCFNTELVSGEIRSAIPDTGFESIYTIGVDAEVLKDCAIDETIDYLYFKLSVVTRKTEAEVYTTDFAFGELVRGRATASRELLNAVKSGKIIRVPISTSSDNQGYVIVDATVTVTSGKKDILYIHCVHAYHTTPTYVYTQAEFNADTTSATLNVYNNKHLPTNPDWSINRKTDPNYIANRTHYHHLLGNFTPGQRYSITDTETVHDLNNYRLFLRGDLFKIKYGPFSIEKDGTSLDLTCTKIESDNTVTWHIVSANPIGFEENEYITVVSKLGDYKPLDRFYLPSDLTDIKASQIVLDYDQIIDVSNKFHRVFGLKSKNGYEEHNLNVIKKLAPMLYTSGETVINQDINMFFYTFNGNIGLIPGSDMVFSAPIMSNLNELVTGYYLDTSPHYISNTNIIYRTTYYKISIDAELLRAVADGDYSISDIRFKMETITEIPDDKYLRMDRSDITISDDKISNLYNNLQLGNVAFSLEDIFKNGRNAYGSVFSCVSLSEILNLPHNTLWTVQNNDNNRNGNNDNETTIHVTADTSYNTVYNPLISNIYQVVAKITYNHESNTATATEIAKISVPGTTFNNIIKMNEGSRSAQICPGENFINLTNAGDYILNLFPSATFTGWIYGDSPILPINANYKIRVFSPNNEQESTVIFQCYDGNGNLKQSNPYTLTHKYVEFNILFSGNRMGIYSAPDPIYDFDLKSIERFINVTGFDDTICDGIPVSDIESLIYTEE